MCTYSERVARQVSGDRSTPSCSLERAPAPRLHVAKVQIRQPWLQSMSSPAAATVSSGTFSWASAIRQYTAGGDLGLAKLSLSIPCPSHLWLSLLPRSEPWTAHTPNRIGSTPSSYMLLFVIVFISNAELSLKAKSSDSVLQFTREPGHSLCVLQVLGCCSQSSVQQSSHQLSWNPIQSLGLKCGDSHGWLPLGTSSCWPDFSHTDFCGGLC